MVMNRHDGPRTVDFVRDGITDFAFFLTTRTVEIWNSLPESVIQAKTVKQFEIGLDEHWSTNTTLRQT
jgi:hypothetical protein